MRVDTHTESGAENSISILTDYFKTVSSPFYLEEMKNYWSLVVSRAISHIYIQIGSALLQ